MLPSEERGSSLIVFFLNTRVYGAAIIRCLREVIRMAAGKEALKAVLIDLSGTLHVEDTAIPGAVDALKRYVKCTSAVG